MIVSAIRERAYRMTREKSFKKLAILFVKMELAEKDLLEKKRKERGYSSLSEFIRFELRKALND